MEVISVRTPGLVDATYLPTHDGMGVHVDPKRDIERFTSIAATSGVQLRCTLETHLHNDDISGGLHVARATGAELVLPAAAGAAYPHTQAFRLEDLDGGNGLSSLPGNRGASCDVPGSMARLSAAAWPRTAGRPAACPHDSGDAGTLPISHARLPCCDGRCRSCRAGGLRRRHGECRGSAEPVRARAVR